MRTRTTGLLTVLLLASSAGGAAASDCATAEPRSYEGAPIAFAHHRDNALGVYVVRRGGKLHRISDDVRPSGGRFRKREYEPVWSPRHDRVAFTGRRTPGTDRIWVVRPRGAGLRSVTYRQGEHEWGDESPSWSPGGHRIAYVRHCEECTNIITVPLGNRQLMRVSFHGVAFEPRWAPKRGSNVAYESHGHKGESIWVVRPGPDHSTSEDDEGRVLDGPSPARIVYRSMGRSGDISWAPGGKRFAFSIGPAHPRRKRVLGPPRERRIAFFRLRDDQLIRLTRDKGSSDRGPVWSPDGRRIAFVRHDGLLTNIWLMRADGSNLRQLTYSGTDANPVWSPNGRRIAYVSRCDGDSDIYVTPTSGAHRVQVTNAPGPDREPDW